MLSPRYALFPKLLATAAFALFVSAAIAQSSPGRITGNVKDPQGAAVSSATVKLSNLSTGFERTAATDDSGQFNFPELAIGTYQLRIDKLGFKTTVLNEITTALGQVNTLTPVLAVGDTSTQVEVTADPLLLQTETNSSGGQLSEKQVTSLPIGNSDYTRLALTLPGVTQNSNFAFAQYTINGSRSRSNGFNIDGISNTDPSTYLPSLNEGGNSATAATRLPLDGIAEVSVVSAAPADTGQNSGSVMNAIVKSGTNQLHGTVYELHRDAALDATNYFENLGGVPKAPFVWNEYGGSVGGPIFIPHAYDGRNRTFFFFAYDGSQLRLGTTLNGSAPTPLDISQAEAALATQGMKPNQLGLNVLNLYTNLGLSGSFVKDNRGRQSPNSYIGKLDHKFTDRDLLSARFIYATGEDEFPGGSPGPQGGSQLNPWFGVTPTEVDNFGISETHTFTTQAINSLRLGWNRFSQFQKGRDFNVDPMSIGLNTGVGPESYGIPEFDIGGSGPGRYSNLGLQYGAGGRVASSFQVADDFSLTHGKHAFKFGFNYLHDYSDYTLVGSRGLFTFDGSQLGTQLVAALSQGRGAISFNNPQGVAGLIDLLGGMPSPGNTLITRVGTNRANIYQNLTSGYFMDTYKATDRLTVIAGLRYDYFGTMGESRGRFSAFSRTLGLVNVSRLPGGKLYDAPPRNFGPRIAISYAPPIELLGHRETIIRAGYGIYYDTLPMNNFEQGLPQNPIGPTAGYTIVPDSPIPFAVNVPIFGTGAPEPPLNVASVDHQIKTPNTQIWSFNIQQELSPRLVLQIGYWGNKSTRQIQLLDLNQPTPGLPDPDTSQHRRPYNVVFPALRQVNSIESLGWANYNSLQLVLKSNNFHGLTTQAAFTWSHNLATASEVDDFSGTSGYVPQDSRNLAGGYGNAEFDQRRALIITYIYAIPTFTNGGHLLAYAVKDWQLAGTTTFRDGFASPVLTADGNSGTDNFHERPDCVGPIHYQLKDFTQPYVKAGALQPEAPGTFGNCALDPITAPGLDDWDISLQRTLIYRERYSFEFRTAFFNAFNHPNFAEPSPDLSTLITATADDGSYDSHFGVGGPRNIQFSGKIRW